MYFVPIEKQKSYDIKLELNDLWEFLYVFLAAIATASYGLFIWSESWPYDGSEDVTSLEQIVGGSLIILGARIGCGCTSGHGISGMGHLRTKSMIGTACMFLGGIAIGVTRNILF